MSNPESSPPDRLEPLGLTVHSLPAPGELAARQRTSGRWKMLLVMAVCAAPVVASYFTYYVVRPGSSTSYSALVQPTVAMPAIEARALDGTAVALRSLRGQWLMVVVDSGACAADCERRLFMQRQLREMMGRDRDRIDKLWLVIDDAPVSPPLRDALMATPAMNVLRVPRAVVAGWLQPEAGQKLEDHVYIVDPVGEWMMRTPANPDPTRLKRDIERLLRASAGWDQPGRQAVTDTPPAASPAAAASAAR